MGDDELDDLTRDHGTEVSLQYVEGIRRDARHEAAGIVSGEPTAGIGHPGTAHDDNKLL